MTTLEFEALTSQQQNCLVAQYVNGCQFNIDGQLLAPIDFLFMDHATLSQDEIDRLYAYIPELTPEQAQAKLLEVGFFTS